MTRTWIRAMWLVGGVLAFPCLLIISGCTSSNLDGEQIDETSRPTSAMSLTNAVIAVPDWTGARIRFEDIGDFIEGSIRVHRGWQNAEVQVPPELQDRMVRANALRHEGRFGFMLVYDLLNSVAKETGTRCSITEQGIVFSVTE